MQQDIIQHLQDYLGASIEKVDPNTQAIDDTIKHHPFDKLAQAIIPAVLVAFYKFTRMEEGVKFLVEDAGKHAPLEYLLGDKKNTLIQRVAAYANVPADQAAKNMEAVADETIRFTRHALGSTYSAENLQLFFASQRQSILTHLPEDLQMGELLNDSTIDDRTNKMEGPVSSLAQSIQGLFSSPGLENK